MDLLITIPKEIEADLTILAGETPLEEYAVGLLNNYLINKAQEVQAIRQAESIKSFVALPLDMKVSLLEFADAELALVAEEKPL